MRHAPKLFAAVVAATLAGAALAQDYPNRSIRMVVPFPPAGGTDNLARLVVNKVSLQKVNSCLAWLAQWLLGQSHLVKLVFVGQ